MLRIFLKATRHYQPYHHPNSVTDYLQSTIALTNEANFTSLAACLESFWKPLGTINYQTWNLSKNLQDPIFGRKNFTHWKRINRDYFFKNKYTADKNFTRSLVATVATNSKSVNHFTISQWCHRLPVKYNNITTLTTNKVKGSSTKTCFFRNNS